MEEENKNFLSDAQKAIVLKYLQINPDLFEEAVEADPIEDTTGDTLVEDMLEELNLEGQTELHSDYWFNAIEVWKQSVRKDYLHAKKTRTIVASFEDLQLLLLTQGDMEDEVTPVKQERKVTCRICTNDINERDSFNLFTSFVENVSLGYILNTCTQVTPVAEGDGLPDTICFHCSTLLRMVHSFRQLCERSDEKFRTNKGLIQQKREPQSDDEASLPFDTGFQDYDDYPVERVKTEINEESMDSSEESSSDSSVASDTIEHFDMPSTTQVKKKRSPRKKAPEGQKKRSKKVLGPQQCNDCGKIFPSNYRLQTHRENVHATEKSHSCDLCGKAFNTANKLSAHLVSHTDERPYVCETCGKGFRLSQGLRTHELSHSQEKKFKCEFCPFAGNTKAYLKTHMRTHTGERPFACEQCGLAFITYGHRSKHVRNVHQKIREHKCKICGKEFFKRESAMKHIITHTGAKHFSCSVPGCNVAYGWYAALRRHYIKLHPNEEMPKENSFFKLIENSFQDYASYFNYNSEREST
ncbi:zinc finger protein 208-like isoform X1 [Lutzomyia longipalpis]|uniref:C2h2-type zn-finger protein n=1 Tax=Lutzomyia longipalpis TaxID=7200 RepID=A0A1B0CA25_LUTLO|nr:zinc finger protein 208-like isoform X1 [Lutzomyia longipalpis]